MPEGITKEQMLIIRRLLPETNNGWIITYFIDNMFGNTVYISKDDLQNKVQSYFKSSNAEHVRLFLESDLFKKGV